MVIFGKYECKWCPIKVCFINKHSSLQSEEQQTRRKEQNRAAQRAFRERKERYVKELELKIETMEKEYTKNNEALKKENEELQSLVKSMEADIYTLRGAVYAFEISANKLREAGIDVPVDNNQTVSPPGSGSQRPLVVEGKVSPVQLPLSNMSYKRPGEMVLDIFSPNLGEPIYQTHVDTMIQEDVGRLPCVTESFAQSTSKRFEHEPHPDTLTGVRMIPYSQVWERLSDHPRIEEVNIEELCREMKQKAKCSGSGAVIEEEELEKVLRRLDNGA
ncbi:hypothetical protein CLU79DRAFT_735136 [Phycomyces nitens]|nr:hypothetical protein CLU79DRAFT_735136 [Phycomyces nitens]